jgi:hypothetical protein
MNAFRSSSIITTKLNLQPILNIELFPIHIESKLDMLGFAGKLVKDVVHLWRKNVEKRKTMSSFHKLAKGQTTTFGFQEILGINPESSRDVFHQSCLKKTPIQSKIDCAKLGSFLVHLM